MRIRSFTNSVQIALVTAGCRGVPLETRNLRGAVPLDVPPGHLKAFDRASLRLQFEGFSASDFVNTPAACLLSESTRRHVTIDLSNLWASHDLIEFREDFWREIGRYQKAVRMDYGRIPVEPRLEELGLIMMTVLPESWLRSGTTPEAAFDQLTFDLQIWPPARELFPERLTSDQIQIAATFVARGYGDDEIQPIALSPWMRPQNLPGEADEYGEYLTADIAHTLEVLRECGYIYEKGPRQFELTLSGINEAQNLEKAWEVSDREVTIPSREEMDAVHEPPSRETHHRKLAEVKIRELLGDLKRLDNAALDALYESYIDSGTDYLIEENNLLLQIHKDLRIIFPGGYLPLKGMRYSMISNLSFLYYVLLPQDYFDSPFDRRRDALKDITRQHLIPILNDIQSP